MERTSLGMNRTGAAMSPSGTQAMLDVAATLTPVETIDTDAIKAQRMRSIDEAEAVGSVPPPPTVKGMVKSGVTAMKGGHPGLLLDKLGERLAFERAGVRLYEALVTKAQALSRDDDSALPDVTDGDGAEEDGQHYGGGIAALERIRDEELAHFRLLKHAIEAMGGDPTVITPCADVAGTASIGFMQVLTDPRTTLAQCLNVMLAAELTDNAGWELLIDLAGAGGNDDLVREFLGALSNEQAHALTVRRWLEALMKDGVGSKAV